MSKEARARRLAGLAKARAIRAGKRVLTGYGDAMGSFQTNRGRRKVRRNVASMPMYAAFNRRHARRNVASIPVNTSFNRPKRKRSRLRSLFTSRISRSRVGPRIKSSRGRSAKNGGRTMATAKQLAARRLFAARARAGSFKKNGRKGRRKARRNQNGAPLSGGVYRPSLPKGPLSLIVRKVKKKYKSFSKKVLARATPKKRKAKKVRKNGRARRNAIYTLYNKPRKRRARRNYAQFVPTTLFNRPRKRKARKNGRLSSRRARAMAKARWSGKRKRSSRKGRRARRNFGGGLMAKLKSSFSMDTAKSGLAVLAGAIAATGAPSLLGSWNDGYLGLGLTIAAAGLAGVAAAYLAPKYVTEVASGGIVVVGLKLAMQFAPKALVWSAVTGGPLVGKGGTAAGLRGLGMFYGTGAGTADNGRLRGFLPPVELTPPSRQLQGMGSFMGPDGRGMLEGSPERFKSGVVRFKSPKGGGGAY